MDSKAVLSAIGANPARSTQRVSGKHGISYYKNTEKIFYLS